MPRVQVGYLAPVEVVVDTDAGTVARVVVIDEEVRPDRDDAAKDGRSVHTDGYGELTDPDARKRAIEIADQKPWPAWEHGF